MNSRSVSTLLRVLLIAANISVPLLALYFIWVTNSISQLSFFGELFTLNSLGKLAGTAAALTFVILSYPGILRRFKVGGFLKFIQLSLTPIRPHLGVLMFLLAFTHYVFVKIVPTVRLNLPLQFQPFEFFGFAALFLCLPLALTSTFWVKKRMKQNWQKLHNLTYFILWIIFGHVALLTEIPLAILLMITGILQILSFLVASKNSSTNK